MNFKENLEDYTELEFLELLAELFENKNGLTADDYENLATALILHIVSITEHPEKSDLLCYPAQGREDSPEGILAEVKRWRAAAGKPGFKAP
ncbi:bacteriocin immunity protein [Pseudomonas sp.]|uniref:bacteriocin immunity protein n=1 Tax=Pseudomonas sp. TaxID=306 RepID=UPI00260F6371|nr:bacteriocin immunity protein [Pseudomonas sp.]